MSKSILEIDTPESCVRCGVAVQCSSDFGSYRMCGLVGSSIDLYAKSRHPDCPLKPVSGNKEFTIGVIGRMSSEYRTYNVRAQNKKRAKEKALELFRDECGENFDFIKVLSTWEHKEAKDG